MGCSTELTIAGKALTRAETSYALLFGAGHAATVPGGHPSQLSPGMETINDDLSIEEWVDRRLANGADYIKVVRESQAWMGEPPLPTLSFDQIEEIIRVSHERGLRVVVHSSTLDETVRIAEMGADGFVHMPSSAGDYPPSATQLEAIRESGAFVVPTAILVPHGNRSLAGAPPPVRQWAEQNILGEDENVDMIRRIAEAGIPIVAGTDAPNTGLNFGDHLLDELGLYQQAGLSNIEVLRSATGNAAGAFGLPVGALAEGAAASFVLLEGSPIEDLVHLRAIAGVWKDGVPH